MSKREGHKESGTVAGVPAYKKKAGLPIVFLSCFARTIITRLQKESGTAILLFR